MRRDNQRLRFLDPERFIVLKYPANAMVYAT